MSKTKNKGVLLQVVHSGENNLTIHNVIVPSEITSSLTGTYGDIDDDSETNHADIRDLVKHLGIPYDSGADNLLIEEFTSTEEHITKYNPQAHTS